MDGNYCLDIKPVLTISLALAILHPDISGKQCRHILSPTLHRDQAQWLSGRVLDSRPRVRRFEPHRRHCIVVLGQDAFILA